MTGALKLLRVQALAAGCLALGCSNSLALGNDLVWTADQESSDLKAWTATGSGDTHLPSVDSTIEVSTEMAHGGKHAVKFVNPANWDHADEGPVLFHAPGDVTTLADAYYSAWFFLPEDYRIDPSMTLVRLGSRDVGSPDVLSGEQLQLRSLESGGYVLQVFNNNAGFLLAPIAEPAPHIESARWFQIEARYEPQASGRLRVWLDGTLTYDLANRPGAAGAEMVFSVCDVAESAVPAPVVLFVDDAAVSLSRVGTTGMLE